MQQSASRKLVVAIVGATGGVGDDDRPPDRGCDRRAGVVEVAHVWVQEHVVEDLWVVVAVPNQERRGLHGQFV